MSDYGLCAIFFIEGNIRHEGSNDWRFKQRCQQFFFTGWWFKVKSDNLVLHSFSAILLPLTFSIAYAAFHFLSMTCPNQQIRWTFQMWNHRRLFMKIQASVSCYHVLTDSIFMAFLSTRWTCPLQSEDYTGGTTNLNLENLRLQSIYNSV